MSIATNSCFSHVTNANTVIQRKAMSPIVRTSIGRFQAAASATVSHPTLSTPRALLVEGSSQQHFSCLRVQDLVSEHSRLIVQRLRDMLHESNCIQHHPRSQQHLSIRSQKKTNHRVVFVAAAVTTDCPFPVCSDWEQNRDGLDSSQRFRAQEPFLQTSFGINHALHCAKVADKRLSGLLKGCAEQNALGSFAAQGLHTYEQIKQVFVLASDDACSASDCSSSCTDNADELFERRSSLKFPCRECFHHICRVNEFQQQRDEHLHNSSRMKLLDELSFVMPNNIPPPTRFPIVLNIVVPERHASVPSDLCGSDDSSPIVRIEDIKMVADFAAKGFAIPHIRLIF